MSSTVVTFTSTTTWTAPTGIFSVFAECWGAGGSGGRGNIVGWLATGGGGGAYSNKRIIVVPGNIYTVTVGAGGSAPGGSSNGNVGGDTWFSTSGTILAKGGSAGLANASGPVLGAPGGQASSGIGDVTYSGGNSGNNTVATTSTGGGGGAGSTGNGQNSGINSSTGGTSTSINGGAGGNGGTNLAAAISGSIYGGAGGGNWSSNQVAGAGAGGFLQLTYANIYSSSLSANIMNSLSRKATTSAGSNTTISPPVITFRQAVSPYSILSSLTYIKTSPSGTTLPVLDNEKSDLIYFRIYNNYAASAVVAPAINVSVTTYDGTGHTASMAVASQEWLHILQSGFGSGSSGPSNYTAYLGTDTVVGGSSNQYLFEYGSNGAVANSEILTGPNFSQAGFLEAETYIKPIPGASGQVNPFVITVQYQYII